MLTNKELLKSPADILTWGNLATSKNVFETNGACCHAASGVEIPAICVPRFFWCGKSSHLSQWGNFGGQVRFVLAADGEDRKAKQFSSYKISRVIFSVVNKYRSNNMMFHSVSAKIGHRTDFSSCCFKTMSTRS